MTEREAVQAAIDECLKIGRAAFRAKYGFGKATDYFVLYGDQTLDSKPIIAVAFGLQHNTKPLLYNDFSGGAATVEPVLKRLGFTVVKKDAGEGVPLYTSYALSEGEVYTRAELRDQFGITDATLNNGVFRPQGTRSIWLFVTKHKSSDRVQLHDDLKDGVLTWSGQPSGRTDHMIIDHLDEGDELLVFYRESRSQFEGAGFRFEGVFNYSSHSGSKPASFILAKDKEASGATAVDDDSKGNTSQFDPVNLADGRRQTLALVTLRQGQGKFRRDLLDAYEGRCAVTGCAITQILEAAHIVPFRGKQTNHVSNGLLLRADIHTLFDLGLISFDDDGTFLMSKELIGTEYAELKGIKIPTKVGQRPNPKCLRWHRETLAKI